MSRANEERRERAREARLAAERELQLKDRRQRRLWQLGAVVAVAVIVVVIAVVVSSSGGSGTSPKLEAGKPVPYAKLVTDEFRNVHQDGINLGNPSAPVTLVEFGDLKCPVCQAYNTTVFPVLLDRYVKPGKVRMVYRVQHFVGEPPSDTLAAARFALAAGLQNKLWSFTELFYRNQQPETERYVTDDFLRRLGSAIPGLNVAKALSQRNSAQVNSELTAAGTLFNQYGFTGTPSFLIGGKGHPLAPLNYSNPTALAEFTGPIEKLLKG